MLIPPIIYGLAWKKERTVELVIQAVKAGFRGIDVACQLKHYREDLLGDALKILQTEHQIPRDQLWLQTKFTSIDGQDPKGFIPYDPASSIADQVKSSVETSLRQLGTGYLDSLVLHSPLKTKEENKAAWTTLESFVDQGIIHKIGISNIYDPQLLLWFIKEARVPVSFVQNRWYQGNGWDWMTYDICRKHNIQYQSFWTLSGSPKLLSHPSLLRLAKKYSLTPEQAVYTLAMGWGIVPLTGTTSVQHMAEDLAVAGGVRFTDTEMEEMGDLMGKD